MSVRLQIVGIYYNQLLDLDFSSGSSKTPKDVLDYAINNPINDPGGDPTIFLAYSYAQVGSDTKSPVGNYVDFIAATYTTPTPASVGKNSYVAGTYGLAQTFTGLGSVTYSVWQYYIRDETGLPVPIDPPESPFNSSAAAVINDGYTLIWRLVSICGGQLAPSSNLLAANTSTPNLNARFSKLLTASARKNKP